MPIRAMRVVTDPIVDSSLFLLNRVLLPIAWRAFYVAVLALNWVTDTLVVRYVGETTAQWLLNEQGKVRFDHLANVSLSNYNC
jgi:hypothetical protein